MSSPDLLRRLELLYGLAFVARLVNVGEEALRVAARGGEPPRKIVVKLHLRAGRVEETMVESWHPV